MPLDRDHLRDVFANVATSVAVVTAYDENNVPHGMTVGSVCALSLEPPLVLFCVGDSRGSYSTLCAATRVCISMLAQEQSAIAQRFAGRPANRFGSDLIEIDGLPAVADAACWLVCCPERVVSAGDHGVIIASIRDAQIGHRQPLVYWQREYGAVVRASMEPTPPQGYAPAYRRTRQPRRHARTSVDGR